MILTRIADAEEKSDEIKTNLPNGFYRQTLEMIMSFKIEYVLTHVHCVLVLLKLQSPFFYSAYLKIIPNVICFLHHIFFIIFHVVMFHNIMQLLSRFSTSISCFLTCFLTCFLISGRFSISTFFLNFSCQSIANLRWFSLSWKTSFVCFYAFE